MTRISKQIAQEVSSKLTAKKSKELENEKEKLKSFAYRMALYRVPKDVMKCYKKNKNFFNTTGSFQLYGDGFNYEYIYFEPCLPTGGIRIAPSVAEAKEVRMLLDSIQNKKKALVALKNEIEIAVCNLKTYSNVEKEFKEAFKVLPNKPITQALTININSIREKL